MNNVNTVLTIVAVAGSGLVAGIWFAFSNFVMQGLDRLPPEISVAAMQSINVTVLNPVFFAAFFGTALVCVGLAGLSYFRWDEAGSAIILAASLLYLVGSIGVTVFANVPLNEALASAPQAAASWSDFFRGWMFWNHVRTVTALLATTGFAVALG